jgi:hypothetical protein
VDLPPPAELDAIVYCTVDPEALPAAVRERCDVFVTVGGPGLERGQAEVARRVDPHRTERVNLIVGATTLRRHERKYAAGELGRADSFYFTGPERKLHLRAGNLLTFLQLAEGVDDATWRHHLRRHDYSTWIRTALRDEVLANEIRAVEDDADLAEDNGRRRIDRAIRARYTLPVR